MLLAKGVTFATLAGLTAIAHAISCPPYPPVPPRPVYASLKVSSGLLPDGSKDQIRISVFDNFNGLTSTPAAAAQAVDVSRSGWEITISAVLLDPCVLANPTGPFEVEAGYLPAGEYFVSYSSSNQETHTARLKFRVAESGATTPWPTVTVVEFFSASLDRHFMTVDPVEIRMLDDGTIRGWSRTGEQFSVFPSDGTPPHSGVMPVCRLYGLPERGLDSHFFSMDASECATVLMRWPSWILEQEIAFGATGAQGSAIDGLNCGPDGTPLFRLYSNRAGADHRYTISTQVRDSMVTRGWILEGAYRGSDGMSFAMCVQP